MNFLKLRPIKVILALYIIHIYKNYITYALEVILFSVIGGELFLVKVCDLLNENQLAADHSNVVRNQLRTPKQLIFLDLPT